MPTAYFLLVALAQGILLVRFMHTASGRDYVHSRVAGDQLIPCMRSINLQPFAFHKVMTDSTDVEITFYLRKSN